MSSHYIFRKPDRAKAAFLVVFLILAAPWCVEHVLQIQQKVALVQQTDQGKLIALKRDFIDLGSYSSVRFHEQTGVCGFESDSSPYQVFQDICLQLEENDWACIPAGETSASFYRDKGTYTWAYVSCGSVQGSTVVVCNLV